MGCTQFNCTDITQHIHATQNVRKEKLQDQLEGEFIIHTQK